MTITKFEHSCLLVESDAPNRRATLFDPGAMSETWLKVEALEHLDDIIITHGHGDHMSMALIKQLVAKFPEVTITATPEVVAQLHAESITASSGASEGMEFFDSPHEEVEPLFPQPEQIGVHYLNVLTHPGDSHHFTESKAILALPITGPWGSTIKAVTLALELKPRYIIPIHDWHWREEARKQFYDNFEVLFNKEGISFYKMVTAEPITIDI